MAPRRDPLADPGPLIRRLYSYVAYRIGDGPDAEDVTSEAFARAVRSRGTYDHRRGAPITWLTAIARSALSDHAQRPAPIPALPPDAHAAAPQPDMAAEVVERMDMREAVNRLPERDRELIAMRYGADLTVRQIAELLEMTTTAVETALSRALARLRESVDRAPV